ncbi:MAG: hypothetical protein EWV43_17585 [Microcystis panniformis Mp_MB_F_20080800_S26D]|uniref:Uncharacterized protein n=1 Tax=Microcystis aeruginosa Ma_MB_F_20061100_S20D TaxID=2486253 RepID=A0A552EV51_MICAE|nr:MAG: hypothetical protein EWV50_15025 [Microcystis aeruginosa Ma_MB_F_20061100_S20]TRU38351.1 MAG: hypothetical protein EWV78_05355 [Microcystis aeruginosa Ma_MB_F_20061100_S20D]TRV45079.1 MAG: hypothetical protein EWV43_17585 [Microcystis panniformis Mp_MB_F_20080800_S26D]
MASFYYGSDQGQAYWINLDHVCFVKPEIDKLILKMSDGNVVGIDGEDYDDFQEVLASNTVNWGTLFDEPPVDYGYDNSQSTDDDHLDIEPPTGIPI